MSQLDVDLISQQQVSIVASFASVRGSRLHRHFMPICSETDVEASLKRMTDRRRTKLLSSLDYRLLCCAIALTVIKLVLCCVSFLLVD
jgi:hypothetical protein